MLDYEIHGGKGGEQKAHTPVETPNNLLSVAYAKVLIAVAEGELAGVPTDQDIFLDGTPLQNPDGSMNFGGVKWEWRPGSSDQTYIAGLPEVSTEYNVGIELKTNTPYVRNVTKSQLDAVRVTFQWPALLQQMQNGDTVGVSMDYSIDISTAGGPFVEYQKYNINGKTNTAYERTHRIELPKSTSGWIIRARRLTPESTSGTIQDTINVKSITEVADVKQRYPNTALLYVEFDSRMFGAGSIPKISVRTKGRIIRVPSNYNPETRSYLGIWDGSFKWAWSDNPAWVFQDILTQDRFGTGNKVDLNMVDKWALYEIAQYCDVMVDDGHGQGVMKPRHTCNIYIQEKQEAWKVLRDIATIFNGMTYWNGSQFVAIADKQEPLNNIPVFSRANVVDGSFNYTAADDKSIYTSALVSYDEPTNHYNSDIESSFDTEQILRWGGDRQIEISAIGCTDRGEAQRRGKYTLITNQFNRTVSFRTGLQGLNDEVMPGKLIHVVDPLIGGRPFTGRITVAAGRVLTLDRTIDGKAGDVMYITKSDGSSEGRTIQAVAQNIITLTTAYTELPQPNAVWYLEAADLKSQLFRVTKISSPEESIFEIEGVEYNDSKYNAVDNGARLEPRPISVVPPNIQQPPANVKITSFSYVEQEMAVNTMVISWEQTQNAVGYEVQWKVSNGDWVNAGTTGANEVSIRGIYTGQYVARVRAINAFDIKSVWSTSASTGLEGKTGLPPALTSLTVDPLVFGMRVNWTFPEGAEDTSRTEIMYSTTPYFANAVKLADYAYPQQSVEMNGLKAGQDFWFWGRLIDKTGNIGPYYPSETLQGTRGTSSIDFDEYQEYFQETIGKTALVKELAEEIELITAPIEIIGSVDNRVNEVKVSLQKEIDDTNILVDEVNQNLQEQINNIADLADSMPYDKTKTYALDQAVLGADGRLYQAKKAVPVNMPPPNIEYWTDIGQAVVTANGLAARVTTVETTVTQQGKDITAQSTRVDGVVSQLDGKASTTALNTLSTKVTDLDGKVTSQGTAITGVQSSLTTTNQNVTAAQNAANAANTLAGGKGKVLVQSTTPVAADQLAQNLWIDTTNGANTPKRWNGTTWAAVTDKVATDAAQAAANALAQVATKAEASAVNALTTRVTNAEGAITSTSNNVTSLTNSIRAANSAGDNIIPNPSFDPAYNQMGYTVVGSTTSGVPANCPFKYVAKLTSRDHVPALSVVPYTPAKPGDVWRVSALIACGTGTASFNFYFNRGSDPSTYAAVGNGGGNISPTTTWTRATWDYTVPANTFFIQPFLQIEQPFSTGTTIWYATDWHVENITAAKAAQSTADAASSAVSALSSTVTQQGKDITSVSNNVVSLTNSIGYAGGENLSYNPDFNKVSAVAGIPDGYDLDAPSSAGASTGIFSLVTSFMNSAEKAQRIDVTGLNVSALYRSIRNSRTRTVKIAEDQPVCSSIYVRGTPGLGFRIFIQQINAAGGLIVTTNTIMYYLTSTQQRIALNVPSPQAGATSLVMFYRVYGSETVSDGFIEMARPQVEYGLTPTGWTNNGQVDASDLAATSTAVSALSSRVTQQGEALTSASQDIVSLNNTISRTSDNNPTKVYQSVFSDLAVDRWALDGGNTLSKAVSSYSNIAGNTSGATLTLDSTPNLESWWGSTNRKIRFDPSRLYKMTARIQQVSKNGRDPAMYIGVHAFNESGVQLNVNGSPSKVSSHYILAAAAKLAEGVWTTVTTYVRGFTLAGETGGAGAGTVADPKRLITGTAYMSPMVITGHPTQGGVAALDYFTIEDVSEQVQIDASASAVSALTSTVTQQGNTINSVSGRTTNLENTINSTTNGLATKASASAVNDLSSRVSSAEGVLTSHTSEITVLKSSIGSQGSFVAGTSFEFVNSNQDWFPQTSGATMTPGPLFSTLNKYTTVQRNGMSTKGAENPFVRFRFRRKNTTRTSGAMYWANENGGLAESRRANFTITGSEDWQDIEIDLSANTEWFGKTITSIRLDFMNGADTTAIVDMAYFAAGRRAAAASALAVSSLDTKVTQVDGRVTSQATQITNLNTSVGNVNTAVQNEVTARSNADTALGKRIDTVQATAGNAQAQVQQTSTALANLNGAVNAQYSVKVMTTQDGRMIAAGFGLGLESQGGITQSTFAVSADRFAILNSSLQSSATLSAPFVVEGGQVFMADAFIKKATIQNLLVSADINSTLQTNWGNGLPMMQIITRDAQILLRNQLRANTYTHMNRDGMMVIVDGVLRVRMGVW